jgi:ribose transport system permease protein
MRRVKVNALKSKTDSGENNKKSFLFLVIFFAAIIIIAVAFHIISGGGFLTGENLKIIVSHATYPAFIAWGISFLFACGYNDLSIGGVLVLSAFAAMIAGNQFGYPGVIIGGCFVGVFVVFINFNVFAFTKIPSWIAGISLAMIYEAIAVIIKMSPKTKDLITMGINKDIRKLGELPWSFLIMVIGFVAAYLIYTRTSIGLNIRAIGGDVRVARALGINVTKTLLLVGIIAGLFIGVASVIQISYTGNMTVKTGLTSMYMIFQPLAIVLLAQILEKHININIAIPICAFIIYAIFNMLTILGVPSGTLQEAALGAFLIIFGMIGRRGYTGVVK